MYERYKKLLDKKGMKNADVSRGAKVSNMTLSDWKNGKTVPKTDTLRKIADFLEVPVDYFFGSENIEIDRNTHTWEYVISEKDMDLIMEVMSDKDCSERLLAYAKKLLELKNMENL